MGSALVMMEFVNMRPLPSEMAQKHVIMGINATTSSGALGFVCMNETNSLCTLEEAENYAKNLVVGVKMIMNTGGGVLEFIRVEKNQAANNQYDMILSMDIFDYGNDAQIDQYIRANLILILIAFITGNSILEPLIEGLCAQIHVNLR